MRCVETCLFGFTIMLSHLVMSGCSQPETTQRVDWFESIELRVLEEEKSSRRNPVYNAFETKELVDPIDPIVAYEVLALSNQFNGIAVGYGGSPSLEAACCSVLMGREDRLRVGLSLLERAQKPGQLYALCMIFTVDQAIYEEKVKPFRSDGDLTPGMLWGGVLGETRVSDIVKQIDNGYWPEQFQQQGIIYLHASDSKLD